MGKSSKSEGHEKRSKEALVLVTIALALFLSGMIWLTRAIWNEYKQTVVSQQEKQMLLITQSVSDHISSMIEGSCDDLDIICRMDHLFRGTSKDTMTPFLSGEAAKIMAEEKDFVVNINLYGEDGLLLSQVNQQQFQRCLFQTQYSGDVMLSICQDAQGYTFLALQKRLENGRQIELVVDLMKYYEELISSIRLGNNGYVLAKTSDGIIIMHPSQKQLGLDVIEGRRELFQDVDLKDLKEMVDRQKRGEEGISVYHSYWWGDETLPRVKKIAAYTPLRLEQDFFIISSVIDYDDIYVPVETGVVRISAMLLIIFICVLALFTALYHTLRGQQKDKEEIAYLKELNGTLEAIHKSEERMAHQQRLQIIGTMTSGIAHEFNNLLTPIMGYAGMMLEDMSKEDENFQDVKEIYDASEKAKEIIQQISSLSRKNMETAFRYIKAEKMVRRSLKMVRSVCPDNIVLEEKIELGEQGFLGNETQMNQVMLNLCVNGFHAIGKKAGRLIVRADVTEAKTISAENPKLELEDIFESYIRIRIADTGCGMPPEVARQIFNPFFTTKQNGQGTGLGLTIVDNILVSHHGVVTVESEEGKGSEFTLYLPVNREADESLPGAASRKQVLGASLLIVDNNPKVLRILERGLKKIKIAVDTCSEPGEVLEMLSKKHYDFLMTEYVMAGTSGLALAIAARGIYPDIKIIITTGIIKREIIEAQKDGVIDGYMEKPVAFQGIVRMMGELASR